MHCHTSSLQSCLLFVGLFGLAQSKIHSLTVSTDERPVIVLSDFGFLKGGYLKVNITNLRVSQPNQPTIGFSFDKSSSSGSSSYIEREENNRGCVLDGEISNSGQFDDVPRAIMKISPVQNNLGKYQLKIQTRLLHGLRFYASEDDMKKGPGVTDKKDTATNITTPINALEPTTAVDSANAKEVANPDSKDASKADDEDTKAGENQPPARKRRAVVKKKDENTEDEDFKSQDPLPILGDLNGMNIVFYTQIVSEEQIGLYELYFHNCENSQIYNRNPSKELITVGFTARIVEKNGESYLSAGDMALPLMYGVISIMFFAVGVVWVQVICSTSEKVFKIHYLMAVIIFVKGLSVMFHSLDYYFIAKDGRSEAWAVIFYIVHLLKGILLFICLLLIGTGWAFIKYILSDRDKKIFMIVIPLQVIANVAYVIMGETEEGNKSYSTWKNVAILVDLLCCAAVLIPVVWSIRHLQEASQTDGKAVTNLAKLELFRHFYIMVVCYLYFTRIIVYLLVISLPFEYVWIHALFQEFGSFVFFTVTGFKFRPGCDNPYLKLDQEDSDDEAEAITQSGAMENIKRVNRKTHDEDETDEFDVLLPKQRTTTSV